MKIWDALNELSRNPEKKFDNEGYTLQTERKWNWITGTSHDCFYITTPSGAKIDFKHWNCPIDDDYTEVVDKYYWEEALEQLLDGYTVEFRGELYRFVGEGTLFCQRKGGIGYYPAKFTKDMANKEEWMLED